MLHDLDTALRSLVEQEVGSVADVEIDFDAPTKDWASHRNAPTIDLYLYDIRQDLTRLQFGELVERDADGVVTRRRPQPKFFRLAYLVTAWTQRAEDEHRLLSALMVAFLKHDVVPPELLGGSLEDLGIGIPMAVALPPPQDRSLSDVWSALGGELKPSLDLILIAPLLPERFTEAGPPVTSEPRADDGRPRQRLGRDPWWTDRAGGSPTRRQRRRHRPPPAPTADRSRRRAPGQEAELPTRWVRMRRSTTCSAGSTSSAGASPRSSTARRAVDTSPDDPFLGLYLSDEKIDHAAAQRPDLGSPRRGRRAPGRGRGSRPMPPRLAAPCCGSACSPPGSTSTTLDLELLLVAMSPDVDDRFERYYGYLNDDVTRRRTSVGLALGLAGIAASSHDRAPATSRPGPRSSTAGCSRSTIPTARS